MATNKQRKEARAKIDKLDKQQSSIQDNIARSASFIDRYGMHILTILVATFVCFYIISRIPAAFEMWSEGLDETSSNLYVYGLMGCTGLIWLVYVITAIRKMLAKKN